MAAIADELCELTGDQGDSLCVVEAEASCKPLLREEADLMEDKLVEFAGDQLHDVVIRRGNPRLEYKSRLEKSSARTADQVCLQEEEEMGKGRVG
jgi:hypothetical protein